MSSRREERELRDDARAEWWLLPKAGLALLAVAALVFVREFFLP
ncbi:hypothetical protein ACFPZL_10100 [Leucobacter soli]|uniref:Uncharacterized protein n=1 Tax=Leucobacter soli TaxID=2812850 RepID=A0A916NQ39_9MICO|nr:hypothetical protein [Leucobacter soli]CAG7620280.1 hypothetical protein LEUCIP111803_02355 [Leucobacter soli]